MVQKPARSSRVFTHRIRRRTLAIIIVWALIFAGCIVRLADLQLISASQVAQDAAKSRTVLAKVQAMRGKIVDSNNKVLAQSVEAYKIYVDQVGVKNFVPTSCTVKRTNAMTDSDYAAAVEARKTACHSVDGKDVPGKGASAVARILAPVLKLNAPELAAKIAGSNRYVVIAKNVTPKVKRTIDKLALSGIVGSELMSQRVYPNSNLLGAVLGGINDNNTGVAGIEEMADASLKGVDGVETYQQANPINGTAKIPGTQKVESKSQTGGTVQLTIDRDVQWFVQNALNEGAEKATPEWGIAVVQEVSTGNIVAIADTNDFAPNSTDAKTKGSQAITTTFDPGSTGKVITAAGILQEGLHKATDHFIVPYKMEYQGQTYHNAEVHPDEHLTLAGILYHSYNTGTIMTAYDYTLQKRYQYLTNFGIGQATGIGFPGESAGVLYDYNNWDTRTQQTVLFGQGYTVNALQIVNALNTIGNGGVRVGQRLIAKSNNAQGKDTTPTANKSQRVVSKETAATVLNMMENIGELNNVNTKVEGYRLAAKSGTAEVAGANGGLTGIVSDYITIVPADNPKFTVGVFMKNGHPTYGGVTVQPVLGKIVTFLMQKYQIPYSEPRKDAIPVEW